MICRLSGSLLTQLEIIEAAHGWECIAWSSRPEMQIHVISLPFELKIRSNIGQPVSSTH
jgi:hypothetical protein